MENDAEKKLFLEQAAAYYDELRAAAGNATHGKILAQAEQFALVQGRELIRKSLENVVKQSKDDAQSEEKKTARRVLAAELDAIAETIRKKS